jgi:hypothetical protein
MAIVVPKTNTDAIGGPECFSGKSFAVELGTIDLKDAQAASDALSVTTALTAGLRLVVHQE